MFWDRLEGRVQDPYNATRIRDTRDWQKRSGLGVRLSMLASTSDVAGLHPIYNLERLPSAKSCHPAQKANSGAGMEQVAMSVERLQSRC